MKLEGLLGVRLAATAEDDDVVRPPQVRVPWHSWVVVVVDGSAVVAVAVAEDDDEEGEEGEEEEEDETTVAKVNLGDDVMKDGAAVGDVGALPVSMAGESLMIILVAVLVVLVLLLLLLLLLLVVMVVVVVSYEWRL